jgi:hypothetical protein
MSEWKSHNAREKSIARILYLETVARILYLETENKRLEQENSELRKKHEAALKLMGLVMTQPTDISVALANAEKEKWVQCDQLEELRKDTERLDWILSDAGRFWLSTREDIDKERDLISQATI